jgi:hypothetical protein
LGHTQDFPLHICLHPLYNSIQRPTLTIEIEIIHMDNIAAKTTGRKKQNDLEGSF